MIVPTLPEHRDLASLAAGMLAAHLSDDSESFNETAALFETCGEMHQGLIFLCATLASDLGDHLLLPPDAVARQISLLLQEEPETIE